MSDTLTLDMLKAGELGIIKKIKGSSRFKRRLVEMGFLAKSTIRVIKFAPLRDPGEYAINGYYVAIRKNEAADIIVEKMEGQALAAGSGG